jgi:NADH:ubiquinone oxidoreductase subunit K
MFFYLLVPLFLFFSGLIGILIGKKNYILILISLELILLAIIYHYLLIGWLNFGDLKVILLSILLLTVGASESAIGLGIIIAYHKSSKKY